MDLMKGRHMCSYIYVFFRGACLSQITNSANYTFVLYLL